MATIPIDAEGPPGSTRDLPLLGGPFDSERWVAARPPPAVLYLSEHNGHRGRYVLRAVAFCGVQLQAYVLEGLDPLGTASAFVRSWRPPRILPEPWQRHALRITGSERPTCPGCGRHADRYAARSQAQPTSMTLHCLDCGALHALVSDAD